MVTVANINYNEPDLGVAVEIENIIVNNTELSIAAFISWLETTKSDIVFIPSLATNYGLLEKAIIAAQWELKVCKGQIYTPYAALQNIRTTDRIYYTIKMFGHHRRCNQLVVRQKSGHIVKIYDYDKWKSFTEEELNILNINKSTPAAIGRNMIFGADFIYNNLWNLDDKESRIIYRLLNFSKIGGIIYTDYKGQFFEKAYHYDVTSLYPSTFCQIKKWPNPRTLQKIEEAEVANHSRYAYFVFDDEGHLICDVTSAVIPADSYKMLLNLPNKDIDRMMAVFEMKNSNTKNSPQYKLAKLIINTCIGSLSKRGEMDDFFPHYYDDDGWQHVEKERKCNFVERYAYLIAKARQRMTNEIESANSQGAHILQFNTDGFFTDIPIAHDEERFLGSLRFEYEAHNLQIYACNQYSCDEETSIAGLPVGIYEPGCTHYAFWLMQYSDVGPEWYLQLFDLGEEKDKWNKFEI